MSYILVIDGNRISRELIDRTLKANQYSVVAVETALEGIDIARQSPPALVLTDIELSDMTGHELATTLRVDARFADLPIVAIMSYEDTAQRNIAFAAGMTGFLEKPVNLVELPRQLEFFLSGGAEEYDSTNMMNVARARFLQEVVQRLEARIREIREHNRSLERLNQMKDTFIQLTAHELRTPLSLLIGYADLLSDNMDQLKLIRQSHDVETLFDGLQTSVNRMQKIVEEVITTSELMIEAIHVRVREINPVEIIQRILAEYHEALQKRRLSVHFNSDDWGIIQVDENLLRQVMANLISNAIKYTPDGGDIFLTFQQDDNYNYIGVADTGIGIEPHYHEQIFERFFTLHDTSHHTTSKTAFLGGGLGLGLAICRGIIEAHGGQIWLESPYEDRENPPGSEFTIMLPRYID